MKGYCSECGKEIDETEQFEGKCYKCKFYPDLIIKHDGVITRRRVE